MAIKEKATKSASKTAATKKVAVKKESKTTKSTTAKATKTAKAAKATAAKTTKSTKTTKAKTAAKAVNPIEEQLAVVVDAILDKKGQRVCSLDLRTLGSGLCDFFVLCNADSTTNVSAIADNIEDQMIIKFKKKVLRSQGKENRFWIIQDYGDIVVHIFQTEYRDFYRLEELWSDCPRKDY